MYNKLFTKILDSSIWLAPDPHRLVWITLIAAMDEEGHAMFASAGNLAARARVTREQAESAVASFEGPDPDSGDPDNDGRRIERFPGGWHVLNAHKYRALVTKSIIQAQTRERVAKHRAKAAGVTLGNAPVTHEKRTGNAQVTPSEALSVSEEENHSLLAQAPALPTEDRPAQDPKHSKPTGPPDCPHLAVLALWSETLPAMPRHLPTQWRGTRAAHLRARWRETAAEKGWSDEAQGLTYLRKLFGYVGQSAFLTGRAKPRGDGRPFVAELEWLVNPSNWAKVHEGKYHTETA